MSMRNSGTGASAGSVALVKVDTAATVADLANPTDGLGALKAGIDAISTGTIEPRLMAGTPYYVDAAMANDDADGTTPAKAKKTINAAIGVGGAGDIIIIKAGLYTENIVMDVASMELWPELGTRITPAAGGNCISIQAAFCKIWNQGGSLFLTPGANGTGIVTTAAGTNAYISDVRSNCASSADIGFDIVGDGAVLNNCRCADALVAAIKIQGSKTSAIDCCVGGTVVDDSIGIWVTNSASKVRIKVCGSQGYAAAGFQVDAGVTDAVVEGCNSGGGDGCRIDNGTRTTWPDYSFDDVITKTNTLSATGAETVEYNLFQLTGSVKIKNIYAHVTETLTGTNTDCFLEVWSANGRERISKDDSGNTLGQLAIGSLVMRLDKQDKVLVVGDVSAGPSMIDQTDVKEEGFRLVQDHSGGVPVDTFIRFVHTCAAGGTGEFHWHALWDDIGEGCLLAVA